MGDWIKLGAGADAAIDAWLCRPQGPPRGGLVVAQEIFGVNAHIRAVTERFAAAGYLAIAPAFFDHVEPQLELAYDRAGYLRGAAVARRLDLAGEVLEDVRHAAAVVAEAGQVGVAGFCWGGTVAFLAATRLGLPAVSWYGSRNVNYFAEELHAPVQFHFGELDPHIPPEVVAEHRRRYPQAEVWTYAEAGHGFHCDPRRDFEPASAALSWQRALDFLARHVG